DETSALIEELQRSHRIAFDREVVLVDETVVIAAQRHGISQIGGSAASPVLQVMSFEERTRVAAREPAGAVSPEGRPPERTRNRAALRPDRERFAVLVLDQHRDAAIAGEPFGGGRG